MNKTFKKLEKKLRKHHHTLTRETNVSISSTPTKILALCNVGLVNGLSEETILENFMKYGPIEKIILLPGKSCSFVEFRDSNSSIQAYSEANGILQIAQDKKPVYLSYVEDLPSMIDKKVYDVPPDGLILLEDFISQEEESVLLSLEQTFLECPMQSMKHRQVKHYGYEFRYDINNVDKCNPMLETIPENYQYLFSRLKYKYNLFDSFHPDQLTINQYLPGQGIPHHIDTHSAFEDPVISLSLGSPVVMDFKHDDGRQVCMLLPQRSMLIMSGESRYIWTHGIVPKKYDAIHDDNGYHLLERRTRVSLTFRKVLSGECNCEYKDKCDSYISHSKHKELDELSAAELEKVHVHNVYEHIAGHFSETRHSPWPNVVSFMQGLSPGSIVLDIGCGNGKYLGLGSTNYIIGCDRSSKLIELCRERNHEAFICDSLNVPIKDNSVDAVLSIAVIHHFANQDRRLQAIREIIRILRISGEALLYVWAKNQIRNDQKTSYIKQDRKNRKNDQEAIDLNESITVLGDITLPIHKNRSNFKHEDVLVPWKLKQSVSSKQNENIHLRYYHVFEAGELESICKQFDDVKIIKSYYDEGNWCVILKKIK